MFQDCARPEPGEDEKAVPVLADLDEANASHIEQGVDLSRVPIEVLDGEGVHGDVRDVEFQEEAQDALQSLEAFLVSDADGEVAFPGAPSVPIHNESDMARSRSEAECVDDEVAEERVQLRRDPREPRGEREVDISGRRWRQVCLVC